MKRIYITGMSGTGKSAVIERLQQKGYSAIDTDYDNWQEISTSNGEQEYLLNEEKLLQLLGTSSVSPLFISGCCSNQGKFYSYFDHKILLSASPKVMFERIAKRSSNPYGKTEKDRMEILRNYENIQALLKKSVDFEIETDALSIEEITKMLIDLASVKDN